MRRGSRDLARIRSIKPEIWLSPQVMNLSHGARLLFIGLITQADDEGRGSADPRRLKAAIFGGDDAVTTTTVAEWLAQISGQGLATFYDGNGHGSLYSLPTFRDHQYVSHPKNSGYPAPPQQVNTSDYRNGTGTTPPDRSCARPGGSEGS